MRDALIPIILMALVLSCLPRLPEAPLRRRRRPSTAAGTDAAQVTAFLKCLQTAVALGNRLKVATSSISR